MSDINIPRNLWKDFLKTFSEQYAGWLVQVETHDSQTGETAASQTAALHSIELDLEDEKNPRINVTILYDSKEVKHILFRPSHLTLHISKQDGDALRITSVNTDTSVLLRGAKTFDALDALKTLNVLDVVRDEAA
jgi:Family of unknown function (DUF5335)